MIMYKITANIVCNNERYWIRESILSIVNLVDEIIYIDDRSSDGSLEIVEELSMIYSNIRIFKYEEHRLSNLGDLKNYALANSNNDFVLRWDADFIAYDDIDLLFEFCITNESLYDGYILSGPNLAGDVLHQPALRNFFGPECYLFKRAKSRFVKNDKYSDYPNFDQSFRFCYPQNSVLGKNFFFLHTNSLKSIERISFRKRMSEYHLSGFEGNYWSWISSGVDSENFRILEMNRTKNTVLDLIDFDFNKWGEHPKILLDSKSVERFKIKKSENFYYIEDYPFI